MRAFIGPTLTSEIEAKVTHYVALQPGELNRFAQDTTTFGSFKAGLVLTDRRIVCFDEHDHDAIAAADITSVDFKGMSSGGLAWITVERRSGDRLQRPLALQVKELALFRNTLRVLVGPTGTVTGDVIDDPVDRFERSTPSLLLSTTSTIEGRRVKDYLGVITAEVVEVADFVTTVATGLKEFSGGRSAWYEGVLATARKSAFRELTDSARTLGAQGVVGISLDYETVGSKILVMTVAGTAVTFDPSP
jgi:uncharacterized protein YbjQ (UPF0145 family)